MTSTQPRCVLLPELPRAQWHMMIEGLRADVVTRVLCMLLLVLGKHAWHTLHSSLRQCFTFQN